MPGFTVNKSEFTSELKGGFTKGAVDLVRGINRMEKLRVIFNLIRFIYAFF